MFTAAWFIIAEHWKQHRCPLLKVTVSSESQMTRPRLSNPSSSKGIPENVAVTPPATELAHVPRGRAKALPRRPPRCGGTVVGPSKEVPRDSQSSHPLLSAQPTKQGRETLFLSVKNPETTIYGKPGPRAFCPLGINFLPLLIQRLLM